MNWIAFGASALTAVLALIGTYISNRKSSTLMAYRLEHLERKVDAHNCFDKRLTVVETKLDSLEQWNKTKGE